MSTSIEIGVFDKVEDAIDAAYEAQQILMRDYTTEDRDRFIEAIKKAFLEIIEPETIAEFNETGYGRLDQKIVKNIGTISETENTSSLGAQIMSSSKGLTVEYYAPYGLCGALTPVTNGLVTIASNTMTMLAAGNSIIFNCHPAAKLAGAKAVALVNKAITEAGGPANIATMPRDPDKTTLDAIMDSEKVALIIGTGSEEMVKIIMGCKKKVIAAGPGNPPTIIDETADIAKAVQWLTFAVPFENNMLCITEKEIFVLEKVYDAFIAAMLEKGVRLLSAEEAEKVTATALLPLEGGKYAANKKFVGKDANVILEAAGVEKSDYDLQMALIEVAADHPYVLTEQMMPIIPVVKCATFEEAVEGAVRAENNCRHSAAVWTNDWKHANDFGRRIQTSIFVQNGATIAATGLGGTGNGSATVATYTGEGVTTAKTFTRIRRFAMGDGGGYIV
ncbi:MAG: aldehyde dehydrogenase [Coriobacteriales bacterium]|jgi:propionaldehyde dehydrogenase|nr:aldehyde dehydrogenase [Coriobacteriales bacterium]